MMNFLKPFESQAYAAFRIMTGLLFLWHGTQKLFGFPAPGPDPLPPLIMVAGIIELAGGLAVALGLFTRPAAFLCSGTMAAAYFMAHFPQGFFPLVNKGELAVLYCFAFLYISTRGAGIWSADQAMGND
jgi:putative oxidoreductase